MKLVRNYFQKGHALYIDDFYSSLPLAETLYQKGIQVVGTTRPNRKRVPDFILKTKLNRGETVFAWKGNIFIQKWKDKRDIIMLSTRHNADCKAVVSKNRRKTQPKPSCVAEYNQHMDGIDTADQMTSYYSSPRKSLRWYMKVFFHCLDLCAWNANVLYNLEHQKMTYLNFRDSVVSDLIGLNPKVTHSISDSRVSLSPSASSSPLTSSSPSMPRSLFTSPLPAAREINYLPEKTVKGQLCCRLYTKNKKRKMTTIVCSLCKDKRERKVPLCVKDCFGYYHRKKMYPELLA